MISRRCLEQLMGRLDFSQTALFGEFAITHLRPLYQKFHRMVFFFSPFTLRKIDFPLEEGSYRGVYASDSHSSATPTSMGHLYGCCRYSSRALCSPVSWGPRFP